jgi:hypothetical protein
MITKELGEHFQGLGDHRVLSLRSRFQKENLGKYFVHRTLQL